MEIPQNYDFANSEEKWYKFWEENKFFASKKDNRTPYTIVIPPPNVTGVLHMGHMLNNIIQDILTRRARQKGFNACWVPGTDHASIATEAKVVNRLASQGIKKTDLTREEFLKHAWDWTNEHGGIILKQLRKLGAGCDWDRTAFTMDESRSESVLKVFCKLYEKGLIYRGVRMVNWDPKALTALSDEEVNYKEQNGKLYYLRYKVVGQDKYAIVATTRPETIMGDTAMCINPNDPKNAHLKGQKVIVPLVNREIPVIEDEYVDIEFGTGCLKVTPAHDVNDYMLGEKYNLPSIDIFNDNGTISDAAGLYVGMDRFEVRKQIEKDLEAAGLLEKVEQYTNKVGFSERTDVPIEPKLSMQWFLKMESLAKPALDAVMNDDIKFYPPKYKNTYKHWMENIKDWCISRQLWWGHRIPAYYLPKGGFVVAETLDKAYELAKQKADYDFKKEDLRQDEDALDTWFSSWLWPIALFDGINNPNNEEINYYYPTTDLVTGPDIIFFWVARMIMAGYEFIGKMPFKNVYFTGIVRDKIGRKMSKSLGNSPEPMELMKQYSADGVRVGMLLCSPAGGDLLYDDKLCLQGRNFTNKIWNAFRLVKGWSVDANIAQPEASKMAIKWFSNKLDATIIELDNMLKDYRISDSLMLVYKLFWDEFSSWYLESIKPEYQKPIDKATFDATINFFEKLLIVLNPYIPFITEEIYQLIKERKQGASIMDELLPQTSEVDNNLLEKFEVAKDVITKIRMVRQQNGISPKQAVKCYAKLIDGEYFGELDSVIKVQCNLECLEQVSQKIDNSKGFVSKNVEYYIPLEIAIDKEAELKKLKEELKYNQGFLISVEKKLSNERFVSSAPAQVVEREKQKQADAKLKIEAIEKQIKELEA